jgi:hypothetical protein
MRSAVFQAHEKISWTILSSGSRILNLNVGSSSLGRQGWESLRLHMKLRSYFAFLRKEQSKDEAYQLFTTLARDLSDRYPAFKLALGRIIKDNSSLRGTREYRTLFESLLLGPLKNLSLPGPILIVIDALDESGDAIGDVGMHTFIAEHLEKLPAEFRIFVTARPEDGIESAFAQASSVDTLYMDDTNWLRRQIKIFACTFKRSSVRRCSKTMVPN